LDLLLLIFVSVFSGILPMICWAVVVWWFDRYEKEPVHLLAISFLWGVAPAVIISGATELVLGLLSGYEGGLSPYGLSFFNLGIVAPVIEEGVKLLGVLGVFWIAQREIDGPLDGIIYGAMVGFGFAATENMMIFLSSESVGELVFMFFLRAMVFGSIHAMFTSFSGLGLAYAKYARNGWRAFLWAAGGFLLAVAFHSLHNTALVFAEQSPALILLSLLIYGIGIVLVIMLAIGSLIRERKTIRKYLQPYVEQGLLLAHQWEAAASMRTRLYSEWEALSKLDFRKYRMIGRMHTVCAELAFKEKQRQLLGEDPRITLQIEKLSVEMQSLSAGKPPIA
jgi:RsiW-degrading membrane proteinase PrsW (M82 family)